jgi:hypothetical protein
VFYSAIGLAGGCVVAGVLSQHLKSRRKAIFIFMLGALLTCAYFLFVPLPDSPDFYRGFYFFLGFIVGYFNIEIALGAEMFGTNLRATAATSIPNFMRFTFVPMSLATDYLKSTVGLIDALLIVGGVVFALGFFALSRLPETYGVDLNYREK